MTTTIDSTETYPSLFRSLEGRRQGEPGWVSRLREDAISRFEDMGLPSTRQEEWRYTNLSRAVRGPFALAGEATTPRIGDIPFGRVKATKLVFVDGTFRHELSDSPPEGVRFTPLALALRNSDSDLQDRLGRYADYQEHALVALNTALFTDGALIEVSEGAAPDAPIHIVSIATPNETPALVSPRVLVVAGPNSRVQVIESFVCPPHPAAVRWVNAVSEVVCGVHASVDHVKFHNESSNGVHTATEHVRQESGSTFRNLSLTLGGRLVRNDLDVVLAGPGAECALDGLYIATGREHIDNHTYIEHAVAHTTSRELYRGILAERASAVFNGAIRVDRDAQKTSASQQNRNLLLSDDAVINTKPELQIHADDVRCTHGAAIGQLDSDALFYLRTRGFDLESARRLLTRAFAADVLARIPILSIAEACDEEVRRHLSSIVREDA